jgi:hypothetical protein
MVSPRLLGFESKRNSVQRVVLLLLTPETKHLGPLQPAKRALRRGSASLPQVGRTETWRNQ